jgi:hypothetical protein
MRIEPYVWFLSNWCSLDVLAVVGGKWDDYKQAGDRWREMSLKR